MARGAIPTLVLLWVVLYALFNKKTVKKKNNLILRFTPGTGCLKNGKNPL